MGHRERRGLVGCSCYCGLSFCYPSEGLVASTPSNTSLPSTPLADTSPCLQQQNSSLLASPRLATPSPVTPRLAGSLVQCPVGAALHPVLDNRTFPPLQLDIKNIKQEVSLHGSQIMCNVVQAVCPNGYGEGQNIFWYRRVPSSLLQSHAARTLVTGLINVAPGDFIDWKNMKIGSNFHNSPKTGFLIPAAWRNLKVLIVEHHAIICGVNIFSGGCHIKDFVLLEMAHV